MDAIIVDDEPGARRDLAELLASLENIRVVAQASDAEAARVLARRHRPQLIFMDVQMPGADGFTALERIGDIKACVIFTTAHPQHAVRAFEVGAIDYLLKPVDEPRCRRAVERARLQLERGSSGAREAPQPFLEIEEHGMRVRIATGEIRFVTASGNYLEVDHGGGQGLIRQTLENFLGGAAGAQFTRISRNQAVRLPAVRSYRTGGQKLRLYLADGRELIVSRRRAPDVQAALRRDGRARAAVD